MSTTMKAIFHSFLSGMGSILCIPADRVPCRLNEIEAIGEDFQAVGKDISVATDKCARLLVKSGSISDGTETQKHEQLELLQAS